MSTNDLLTSLFDGRSHLLVQPVAAWLASSRPFTAFVTTFHDKIRKKLRTTQDPESLLDLRLELETAYLLLRERSFSLVYEPQLGGKLRGPDFAVSFTTSLTFMLEVTRLRAAARESSTPFPQAESVKAPASNDGRLADTICTKLGQLLPQFSNVLLVELESPWMAQADLHATMLFIRQRAEGNDLAFLQRYRFRDRTGFFQQYQRLSEVLLRAADPQTAAPLVAWVNPQARKTLPGKVRSALYRGLGP
ncbi:MAG TPA: hypothetical protein VGK00_13325 [Anaerolineales bacterium]|jgi:hypothetical protein